MLNIAQIQSSDTFDFQRKRINDAIDIVNSMGGGIAELESEANLPDPSMATSNIYLIRNHSKFKGAALAALINGVYKITPLKNDVMNSNQFVYINSNQLSSLATINKCVYLDSTGGWQLADPSDPNKYAQGIVGPYNSIILGGVLYSPSLNLSVGATYYYDGEGNLTTTPTIGKVGVAIDRNTLSLHFLTIDNLNFQDKETAVNYNHITNCITHIPQDIKLELKGGTLTLKAGSKLYVPNGAGVFDRITISSDNILTQNWSNTDPSFIAWYDNNLTLRKITDVCSGPTDTISGRFHWWYDTTNNVIKEVESDGTARTSKLCLPLAIITMAGDNTSTTSSIDQIFNGFGYIGSCVFALPGVKGLMPNGRNADGTLKNVEFTTSKVLTATDTSTSTNVLIINNSNISRISVANYFYNERENIIINRYDNSQMLAALYGFNKTNNGVISAFTAKSTFQAVDRNDLKLVSKNNDGLVPQLPDETTVKKFLRQDGTWATPTDFNAIKKSGDTMTGTLSDIYAAQVRNIAIANSSAISTGTIGTIYAVLEV